LNHSVFRTLSTFALSIFTFSKRQVVSDSLSFSKPHSSHFLNNQPTLRPSQAANMQYTQLAVLALALGANARSQRRQWGGPEGGAPWVNWGETMDAPSYEVAAEDDSSDSSSTTVSSASAVASVYSNSSSSSTVPATTASATLASSGGVSGGSIPASSGTSALDAVQTIAAGESFDGGMFVYDRGQDCSGQAEGGDSDAVFILEVSVEILR
jgi:hypothetical protein